MAADSVSAQLQIRFITKEQQYAVENAPFAVPCNLTTTELNTLVNELLQENQISQHKPTEFEFLINGEFLRLPLKEHLEAKEITTESVVEIEYFKRLPAPEPQDCLLHDDWVSAVNVCKDWIISGCYDNTVQIWNLKGVHKVTVPGHTDPVKAVSWVYVDDNIATFLSGSLDQTAMLWEWNIKNNSIDCLNIYKGHERNIESLSVSPDKQLFASGGWDTMLKVWSAVGSDDGLSNENGESKAKRSKRDDKSLTKTPVMTLKGHKDCISCVKWSDIREMLTVSWDHTIKLWDGDIGGIKQELVGNKAFFHCDYSELNRTILTTSADKHIRLYDPRSTEGSIVKNTFTSHTQWVQTVEWSETDENLFISGAYDNLLKLWDRRSPRAPLFDLTGHEDKILCCDWSEPSVMVSGGADNTVRVYKSKHAMRRLEIT